VFSTRIPSPARRSARWIGRNLDPRAVLLCSVRAYEYDLDDLRVTYRQYLLLEFREAALQVIHWTSLDTLPQSCRSRRSLRRFLEEISLALLRIQAVRDTAKLHDGEGAAVRQEPAFTQDLKAPVII
jgi:hypothetical protein